MKIYQYAAFFVPKNEPGVKATEKPRIIVEPKTILAADDKSALMMAARDIPEEFMSKLEEVEIAVRPF